MNIERTLKTRIYDFYRITLFFMFLGFGLISNAQENDTIVPLQQNPEKLLRKIDIRKITNDGFNLWQDKFSGHLAGIDFGFNMFLNPDYSGYNSEFMKNNIFRSNSTYINFIQQSIALQHNRNTIGLVTGLGLHLQSYRLDQNTTIQRLPNDFIEPQILFFDQNQKSKLSVASITIPVLAEFQIPINHYDNRLYFSAGLYISYRVSSHTKIKYRIEGKKEKLKVPDHYSLNDFKYGLMVRSGYHRINFFATYELIPLFMENKGPELTPFTFGITLLSF
ncbi:MAG: outer membrane beta-barrel protein [Prolixibacteraceae bacterium]|jgi:hypothetical protein|nr:outer membrane beta-barrel protein [Prolixibacteraceae bacterium]MBT6766508.1 outer membrane beta-barrel protein [Prolixibacteraceae bacterium]MBT6997145.1 outer membrane beta-barrel protein [Prolixibacteraceae bacterium]MBT7393322.1 outer membrane beta-barrel protein [Prolixibacteraceae bacterium]